MILKLVLRRRKRSDCGVISETLGILMSFQKCKSNTKTNPFSDHVMWQCPLYDQVRLNLIKKLEKLKLHLPLLFEPKIQACKIMLDQLMNIN